MDTQGRGLAKELSLQGTLVFLVSGARGGMVYAAPLIILAAWGVESVGRFAFYEAMIMAFVPIVTLGLNEGLAKYVARNAYGNNKYVNMLLFVPSIIVSATLALVVFIAALLVASNNDLRPIPHEEFLGYAVFMASILPLCIIQLLKGAFQGIRQPAFGLLVGDGGLWALFSTMLLMGALLDAPATFIFIAFFISALCAGGALLAVFVSRCVKWREYKPESRTMVDHIQVLKFSLTTVGTSLTGVLQGRADRLVLGLFVTSVAVGQYFLAAMLAGLVTYVQRSVNGVLAPVFANMAATNNLARLRRLFEIASRVNGLVLLIPATVVLVAAPRVAASLSIDLPDEIIRVFQVLIGAQAVSATLGPTHNLLKMIGRERTVLWVSVLSTVAGVPLVYVLTWNIGLLGAAIGTVCYVLVFKVMLYITVKREIGVTISNYVMWLNALCACVVALLYIMIPTGGIISIASAMLSIFTGYALLTIVLMTASTPEAAYVQRALGALRKKLVG